MGRQVCKIADCLKPSRKRGWCQMHWHRWWKYGDPHHTERSSPFDPLRARLERHTQKTDTCWIWTGYTNRYGYGRINHATGTVAHRVWYQELVGPIPEDMELDHLCFNTSCVNPEHLEPVTHHENMRRRTLSDAR